MTRWRKWAAIPGIAAIAALATAVSAYSGASQAGGVVAQTAAATAGDAPLLTNAPTGPWGYSGASSKQGYSPEQPIKFPHPVHVQKAGMNCQYCHFSANKSPDPGMPAVNTCMGCHNVVKTDSPEIQKLAKYWNDKQPIPWVRIHKVPDYVNFPHMRHVNAGVNCQACHGQVQKMNQVFQYASLNMGWCVNCHVNGYDPVKGDAASGYQQQNGRWTLTAEGQSAAPSLVATAHAQGAPQAGAPTGAAAPNAPAGTQGAATTPAAPGGAATTGQIKRARYDCANCHY